MGRRSALRPAEWPDAARSQPVAGRKPTFTWDTRLYAHGNTKYSL
jgi:hypothetical protein